MTISKLGVGSQKKLIKGGNNLMYTFTIVVDIVNVYIILLPPFIVYNEQNDKMQLHKYMNIIKVKQATLATMMILKSNKIKSIFIQADLKTFQSD